MSTPSTTFAHSRTWPACLIVLAALALIGIAPISPALIFLMATGMAWAVAAVGLDAFSGYLGQVSFGHASFVGAGAYGTTVLSTDYGWSFPAAAAVSMVGVAALGAILGSVLLRLQEFGVILGTFFLTVVSTALLSGTLLAGVTNAASGHQTPQFLIAGTNLSIGSAYYYVCWFVLAVVVTVSACLVDAAPGRILRLVKRSAPVARSLGISSYRVRLAAFVWSATLSALAGSLIALGAGYISPDNFGVQASIMLFAMVAVGGLGSIAGPVVGAVLLLTLPNQLQFAQTAQQILFASLLLVVFVGARGGLYGIAATTASRLGLQFPRRHPAGAVQPDALDARPPVRALGLSLHGVTLDYGGVRALDDVGFDVRAGTVHALIGPNGAGKTSLLNCITGLERPTSGTINVTGEVESERVPKHAHRTFQNQAVVPDLTAAQNVALGLHDDRKQLGRGRARSRALDGRARRALLDLGVPESRHDAGGWQLSLAESKLVDLARGIVGAPGLLVLDEPTAGLSHEEMGTISGVVQRLNQETGLTIVVVSHHVGWVRTVTTSATVLSVGKVLAEGRTEDVLALPETRTAFLGDRSDDEVSR
jgi:branched-chain amino acid transport system permease protein